MLILICFEAPYFNKSRDNNRNLRLKCLSLKFKEERVPVDHTYYFIYLFSAIDIYSTLYTYTIQYTVQYSIYDELNTKEDCKNIIKIHILNHTKYNCYVNVN